jgi:hypothetical protein
VPPRLAELRARRLTNAPNSDIDLLLPLQGWTPAKAARPAELAPLGQVSSPHTYADMGDASDH